MNPFLNQDENFIRPKNENSGNISFTQIEKNLKNFIQRTTLIKDTIVNFSVLKKYFKIPFDSFPDLKEVNEVFSRIIHRLSSNKNQTKTWFNEDIILLSWCVVRFCLSRFTDFKDLTMVDWNCIAELIPNKTGEICKFKWLSMRKLNLHDFPWSIEEDESLKELVSSYLTSNEIQWSDIAKKLYLKNSEVIFRPGKHCRERWNNYLDPNLRRGEWTTAEDIELLDLAKTLKKKWSEISKQMAGRTENAVKNRFNSLIKKEKKVLFPNSNFADISSQSGDSPKEELELRIISSIISKYQKGDKTDRSPEKMDVEASEENEETQSQPSGSLRRKQCKSVVHLNELRNYDKVEILAELMGTDSFEALKNNFFQIAQNQLFAENLMNRRSEQHFANNMGMNNLNNLGNISNINNHSNINISNLNNINNINNMNNINNINNINNNINNMNNLRNFGMDMQNYNNLIQMHQKLSPQLHIPLMDPGQNLFFNHLNSFNMAEEENKNFNKLKKEDTNITANNNGLNNFNNLDANFKPLIPNFNNMEVFSPFSPSSAATFSDVSPAFSNYCQRLALNHPIPFDISEYRVRNISEASADPHLQPAYINKATKELFIPFEGESPMEHFKKLNGAFNHPSAFNRINMISPKSHFCLNSGANKGNFGDYLEKRD